MRALFANAASLAARDQFRAVVAAVWLGATCIGADAQITHLDCNNPPCTIGEYRVTLNWIKIKAFDPGFLGDVNPDVIIKTFVQAETHGGETSLFGPYPDTPVGNTIGIGKLIYWHLDCTPSENLAVILDVYDQDGDLGPVVGALLAVGAGIVASECPEFGAAANAVAGKVADAINAELAKEGRFPQWSSSGFTFGDNSGTWTLFFGNGPTRDFEASITFQYIVHPEACTVENINTLTTSLKASDPAIAEFLKRLQDSDGDGVTDQEERMLGSDPNDRNSKPEHRIAMVEENTCSDGLDNDLDGLRDLADVGCDFVDLDGDGVSDDIDNCVGVFNPGQENSDWDGYGDVCDDDPSNPAIDQGAPVFCHDDPPLTALAPVPGLAGQLNTFEVREATYGAQIMYFYGFQNGQTPAAPCPGLFMDIRNAILAGSTVADDEGVAILSRFVPGAARNRRIFIQALELNCCQKSNRVSHTFH